jgi:hypothetical protein
MTGDCHLLGLLSHPSGNSLSDLHRNLADQFGMGILRSAQYEELFLVIEKIKQAGIALRGLDNEIDNLMQNFIQIQGNADRLADLMQYAQFLPNQVQSLLYVLE